MLDMQARELADAWDCLCIFGPLIAWSLFMAAGQWWMHREYLRERAAKQS